MLVGLDVGGTNIDAVIIKDRKIINKVKYPLYNDSLLNSILETLDKLLLTYDKSQIKRINLSTTVSTNAIVKGETSPVGMFIQSGPGMPTEYLACGQVNTFLKGSTDHRGRVVEDINITEINKGVDKCRENMIDVCAVVSKFSTRNPSTEKQISKILDRDFKFVTCGYSTSGKLNFPRRVYTSYLNSAIYNTFEEFSQNIKESFEKHNIDAPIYILKADGGTMNMELAGVRPVESILSGPAASFMGINSLLPIEGDSVFLDIGGTTTDIFFLVNGLPLFEPKGIKIGKYNTLIRSIYSMSIGLGGDSSVKVDRGKVKIGPQKESKPCAFGGNNPTPTDAMITLGYIEKGDKNRASESMEELATELNISAREMAKLILDTMATTIKDKVDILLKEINSKPVYTVKEVLYGRKIKPEYINLIGGPAKSLAPILEEKFSLKCYYPNNYHIANAVGAALAKPTIDITLLADTERKTISVPELGIYESIRPGYNLSLARNQAKELLKDHMRLIDPERILKDSEVEITEESSFNMVDGFYTKGQNIRVKAQVKPGIIYTLKE